MMQHWKDKQALERLTAAQRNHYFYGKLLDEFHLSMEQDYFVRKRWLLNRLGLGAGVLCGLEVSISEDKKSLWITPGVAINALGQEIIVPEPIQLDPWKVTDECGEPTSEPRRAPSNIVTIYLGYRECFADYLPVLVSDCHSQDRCAPGTIVESYCFLVQDGKPKPVTSDQKICEALKEAGKHDNVYSQILHELSGECPVPDKDTYVALAVVYGKDKHIRKIDTSYRRLIVDNQTLFDMVLCLNRRIEECCGETPAAMKMLEKVSNDPEPTNPGGVVTDLSVRVIQGDKTVENEIVTFHVVPGGGKIGLQSGKLGIEDVPIPTGTDGIATLPFWQIGSGPIDIVSASILSGSPATQTFYTRVIEEPVEEYRLEYVPPGDGQEAKAGDKVPLPLVVKVWQGAVPARKPVEVMFQMIGGGGAVDDGKGNGPVSCLISSDPADDAQAKLKSWRLGTASINQVKAFLTADSDQSYTFTAKAKEPVEDTLRVIGVELVDISGTNRFPFTPDQKIKLSEAEQISQIWVYFNHEVLEALLPNDPQKVDESTDSVVIQDSNKTIVRGIVTLVKPSIAVFTVMNEPNEPSTFKSWKTQAEKQEETYHVILYGTEVDKRVAIKDLNYSPLDGEMDVNWKPPPPSQPPPPFSGDGHPGGDFEFSFTITP